MTTTDLIAFACGFLAAAVLAFLYLLHVERMNRDLLAAARRHERRRAYAEGYEDRALLELKTGDRRSSTQG